MLFDLVEESRKVIGIRSDPVGGTRRLVEHLVPFCEKLGLHMTLQAAPDGEASREINLIAHTVPPASPDLCPAGLLLATHLDTVPSGDPALWTETGGDPFR